MKAKFFILGSKLSELDRVIAVLIFLNFCQNVKNWHKASANWTWTWIIKTKKAYFIKTNITRIKIYFLWINELIIPVGKIVFKTNARTFFYSKLAGKHVTSRAVQNAWPCLENRAHHTAVIFSKRWWRRVIQLKNINFPLTLNKSLKQTWAVHFTILM